MSFNRFRNFDNVDPVMCEIKRHLVLLSRYFVDTVKESDEQAYKWLFETADKIENYFSRDEELIKAAEFYRGKYTYTQLKKIKDTDYKRFTHLCADIHLAGKIVI